MNDESTTLFLGDLSVFCTEKDIRKLFRPFGTIEAIRVKRGSSSKTNLSYGFIKFSTRESAEIALQQLSGVMLLGRALRIGWAEGKNAPKATPVPQESKPMETAQVHVSFISKQIDVLISEATLRSLFGLYGEVVDVALKKSQFDRNLRIQNGYGFVHYPLTREGVQSAFSAVASLHQVTIDRVTYDCSVSHALEELILTPQFALTPSPHAQAHPHTQSFALPPAPPQQQQQQQPLSLSNSLSHSSLSHANSPYPSPRTHNTHNHHNPYMHSSFSHSHSHTSLAHQHLPPPPSPSLSSPSLSLPRTHSFSFSSTQLPHTHSATHTPRDTLSDVPLSLSFNTHTQQAQQSQLWSRDPLSHSSLASHTTQQSSLFSVSPQLSPSLSSLAHKQMQFSQQQQRGRTSSGNSISSLSHYSLTPPLSSERDAQLQRDAARERERFERSRSASDSVESNSNNNNNNSNNNNNNNNINTNNTALSHTSNNFNVNFNGNYNSNSNVPSHLSSAFSAGFGGERGESDSILSLSSHHTAAGFSLSGPPSLSLPHTPHTHNPFSPVSSPHTTHHSLMHYATHYHLADGTSERVPQRGRVLSASSISLSHNSLSHHTAFPFTSEGERNVFFEGLSPALLGNATQHLHKSALNANSNPSMTKNTFFFAECENEREAPESESAAALLCGLSVLSLNATTQDVSSSMANETLTF